MPEDRLEIRGARVHNLKGIDLSLPHNQLIVVTGVSGSGKSSLVFDLIYAEGRRRYVESLSSYARQYLERIEKPDVDEIAGISPTVAIRQKNTTRNPHSTVATATEIQDFLRVLFARAARTYCHQCGKRVMSDGVDAVTNAMLEQPAGSRWYVLFPVSQDEGLALLYDERYDQYPSAIKARLAQLRERGFDRLFQGGQVYRFSNPEELIELDLNSEFYVLADRIAISSEIRERIADVVEVAYNECGKVIFASSESDEVRHRFSSAFRCSDCAIEYELPEPRMFGATPAHMPPCERCRGRGTVKSFSMERFIGRQDRSLRKGAVTGWRGMSKKYSDRMLKAANRRGVPVDVAYEQLKPDAKRFIEEGGDGYAGIRGTIEDIKATGSHIDRRQLSLSDETVTCPECSGTKVSRKIRNIRLGDKSITAVLKLTLGEARDFFENLELDETETAIADNPLTEIRSRLRFLSEVGLEYLQLGREARTLSGGEAQRIQLAGSLGSRLVGVCYVLDEPSIGLHPRDTGRLINTIKNLRDLGNTVFVVEHDREMMEASDHLVDLGPEAGERGGEVVYSGTRAAIHGGNGSLTGRYLAGLEEIALPRRRRPRKGTRSIEFIGASAYNLKDIDVDIPVGLMTVITGVSGSGKSTLLHHIIRFAMAHNLGGPGSLRSLESAHPFECRSYAGHEAILRTVLVDQDAMDRTSRSVTVTYMRIFDEIRVLFSRTKQAVDRDMYATHFSFNIGDGRCPACQGSGKQRIDMQFLADIDLPCEDCDGRRFRPETLAIRFKGKNIWDVLQLSVREALELFDGQPLITDRLKVLEEVGLGYLRLGQSSQQMSGGEAQRLKLALHIADNLIERTLFLFDEPTTGLHFDDIKRLLKVFDRLIDGGATVVIVEHNLDVIKCADWVIDLGPEGGEDGGRIVACGKPETVASHPTSHTARYLREALA